MLLSFFGLLCRKSLHSSCSSFKFSKRTLQSLGKVILLWARGSLGSFPAKCLTYENFDSLLCQHLPSVTAWELRTEQWEAFTFKMRSVVKKKQRWERGTRDVSVPWNQRTKKLKERRGVAALNSTKSLKAKNHHWVSQETTGSLRTNSLWWSVEKNSAHF